jgi:hypothetical protein
MEIKKINSMGMILDEITHKSCVAQIGAKEDFATIYSINSSDPGKGHCTELLQQAKLHYESQGKVFGSSVALNERMRRILGKLDISEYKCHY